MGSWDANFSYTASSKEYGCPFPGCDYKSTTHYKTHLERKHPRWRGEVDDVGEAIYPAISVRPARSTRLATSGARFNPIGNLGEHARRRQSIQEGVEDDGDEVSDKGSMVSEGQGQHASDEEGKAEARVGVALGELFVQNFMKTKFTNKRNCRSFAGHG